MLVLARHNYRTLWASTSTFGKYCLLRERVFNDAKYLLKTCLTTGRCRKTFMSMFKKLSIMKLSNQELQTLQILWKHCYFSLMVNLDLLRTLFRWDNLITVNFKRLRLEMKPHMKKLRDFHTLSWIRSLSIKMSLLKCKISKRQIQDQTSR